ncbi:MAG: hypothetical protein ACYC8W_12005 [Candidatus Tyrphobacter sp.]
MIVSSLWGPGHSVFVAALDEVPQGGSGDQEFLTDSAVANALADQQVIHRISADDAA